MVNAKCLASNVRMATVNNIPNLIDIMLGQCPIPFCVARLCFMITPNSASFDESAPAYTDIHGMCHRHAVIVADPPTTVAGASIVNDKLMILMRAPYRRWRYSRASAETQGRG